MSKDRKTRHYLAQFYGGNDNGAETVLKANLAARVVFPNRTMRQFATLPVRLVGIHRGGAELQSQALPFIPDHFYLCLGEGEIYITCAIRTKTKTAMTVSFAEEEPRAFVEALAMNRFPLSMLERIDGRCHPAIQARIRRKAEKTA